jgi:hypothetical protein
MTMTDKAYDLPSRPPSFRQRSPAQLLVKTL